MSGFGLKHQHAAARMARATQAVAVPRPLPVVEARRLRAIVFSRMPDKHFRRSLQDKLLGEGVRVDEHRTPERIEKLDLTRFDLVLSFCKGQENRNVVAAAKAAQVPFAVLDRKPDDSWEPLRDIVEQHLEAVTVEMVAAPPGIDERVRHARTARELVARLVSMGHDDAKKVAIECGRLASLGLPLLMYGDPIDRVARACAALGLDFPDDGPARPAPEPEAEVPPPLPREGSTREERDAAVVAGFEGEPPATFGEALCRARESEGLMQSEVGELLGVAQSTVSAWERDAAVPISAHAVLLFKLFPVLGAAPPPKTHHRDIQKPRGYYVTGLPDEKETIPMPPPEKKLAPVPTPPPPLPEAAPAVKLQPPPPFALLTLDELADAAPDILRAEATRLRRRLRVVEALLEATEER